MLNTTLSVPQGDFTLHRYPLRNNDPLRAWDAADELLLDYVNDLDPKVLRKNCRVLIINDQFGALSTALHHLDPSMLSDSFIAQKAISANLQNNKITALNLINSLEPLAGIYDLVLIKVQKSLAQLEDQLHRIREHLNPQSVVIGAAMVKMIHTSSLKLFETVIGDTKTSLAKKKARLIFTQFNPQLSVKPNPFPKTFLLEEKNWSILNHANVFSQGKLDIGCRFFIEHLPSSDKAQTIIDLGCGNGIVGLVAAQKNPNAQIEFYDESYMAVASAQQNYLTMFANHNKANFHVDDCLSSAKPASADVIYNNPPFHQQNAIGDFIALQMFKQSCKVLKPKGELWVIGNIHLDYAQTLKKLFGNCQKMASSKKFVILRAIKN
ncbi:MAG: 23S rRNA (guanine1835-N2)-methyltransferase [Oceanospirillaceae bacterium]|jgi:23S rRNA (guanine1835-N2)-methyltransferase